MNWLVNTLASSIGKKLMMAVTGLFFCSFLSIHLAGNLSLLGGREMFNSYAEHLHAMGVVLTVAEWGMLLFAMVHIITGMTLLVQNRMARPVRYRVNRRAGGRTPGSATMPYTGVLMLCFVVFHLLNFHFVDKSETTIFDIVSAAFGNPNYVVLYVIAIVVTAVHVSHGFWSAIQTVGANHPKYMPAIRGLSILFALTVGIGFGMLPIYVFMAL
ncbi:MAG: succinate dehydrogenase cytochrome b subunit [Desulfatitalea sp.]|nr:succinate dehydrogenase cytochrome b subunit [Desulfatitalea sp.]NNK01390.1 succinate dehydrogenase cytochrome b subunit [Desulfatitalea sp.]